MNKTELIEKITIGADITKASAGRALNSFLATVTEELARGGEVALVGFGTFSVKERAARSGRNPKTGSKQDVDDVHSANPSPHEIALA